MVSGKQMESQLYTNGYPATAGGKLHCFPFSLNCPFQVFVLMQFGRKKDWPHGKLIQRNNIENRKNIFYPNDCKCIRPQIKITSFRQRDSRIQR